jgi:autophagy-related protein 2
MLGAHRVARAEHAEIFPIRLKLDYKPKRVDYGLLREGKTVELMNFFHFDEAEMTLRHVTLRGLMGWARLFDTLNDIWTPDVKANQLADVLSGIAPVRSLVNVGAGLADLVLLPIEQYQRDGRLARGLQKGAASFAKTTALEAVRLGAKLATGTQVILEQAEHVLGGRMHSAIRAEAIAQPDATDAGSSALNAAERDNLISRYAEQPEDMRDALAQAYAGLSRGLGDAARTILAVPMEVHERSSGAGASRPVIRAVPIAVLRGVAGASEAVSKTLQGLQRELDGAPQLSEDKYKARKPPPRRTE